MLQCHRGTSLCLCFVSVIWAPFSIITWQLIPPWSRVFAFNLSLWIPHWLVSFSAKPSWTSEPIYTTPPCLAWSNNLVSGTISQSAFLIALFSPHIFIFTSPLPNRPPAEVGQSQTETESGWEIEPSCYPLLHKASVLPLTVDGLLCRSLQPMASTLYYIYCPPFFLPISLPPLPVDMGGGGKKDRGSWSRGASGEGRGGDDSTQWDKTNKLVKVTGSFMRSALVRRLLLSLSLFLWAAGTLCRGHVCLCVCMCGTFGGKKSSDESGGKRRATSKCKG